MEMNNFFEETNISNDLKSNKLNDSLSDTEKKIVEIIDNIRPYLISDGGNVEFLKFEDGVVYIRLHGACVNCQMIDVTLKDGIETTIKDEIPEVKEVISIE